METFKELAIFTAQLAAGYGISEVSSDIYDDIFKKKTDKELDKIDKKNVDKSSKIRNKNAVESAIASTLTTLVIFNTLDKIANAIFDN